MKPNQSGRADAQEFSPDLVETVWRRAFVLSAWDPAEYRLDCFGTLIHRASYGEQNSVGWTIQSLRSVELQLGNAIEDLYPLHWHHVPRTAPMGRGPAPPDSS